MIRPARPEEAAALAALELRARHWAYAERLDDPVQPDPDQLEAKWRAAERAWAFDGGDRVYGAARVAGEELTDLWVEPAAQGNGIGSALHDHVLAELRAAGAERAHAWIPAADGQAREFLGRRGWVADGGRRDDGVHRVRMSREL